MGSNRMPRQANPRLTFPILSPHPRHSHFTTVLVLELIRILGTTIGIQERSFGENESELIDNSVRTPGDPIKLRGAWKAQKGLDQRCLRVRILPGPIEDFVGSEVMESPGDCLPPCIDYGGPITHSVKELNCHSAFKVGPD